MGECLLTLPQFFRVTALDIQEEESKCNFVNLSAAKVLFQVLSVRFFTLLKDKIKHKRGVSWFSDTHPRKTLIRRGQLCPTKINQMNQIVKYVASLLFIAFKTKVHPMIIPLGKTVPTPWQKGTLRANPAKGIRIDNMDVTYDGEKQYQTLKPVL